MANSYEEKVQLAESAEKEATEKYDELIDALVLIGLSSMSRKEKMAEVKKLSVKYRKFNIEFSEKNVEKAYKQFAREAMSEIDIAKKKLSRGQLAEMENLKEQLASELDKRLAIYLQNAEKLILKEDLKKTREEDLKFNDAQEKRILNNGKAKREIVFMDSKGRKIKNSAIMKITVGDGLWDTVFSAKRSTFLRFGFRWVRHKSVIDDRTTDICLSLDGKVRDLTKDKIPPMHKGCRSEVVLLPNYSPKNS